jgi:hypothetical protein
MIRQNPTGFRVTDSHWIPSDKSIKFCQMFQILRAVILAILENTLFDASDLTIGSDRQSDGIRPDGFRYNSVTRNPIGILSDCRILYDPKIGSDNRIDRPGHLKFCNTSFFRISAFWQQRFNDECDRLRQENAQLREEYDEQTRSYNDRFETVTSQNSEYLQVIKLGCSFNFKMISYLLAMECSTN